ncbi:hypothetical protein QTN25_000016 [Entamoeba marina]
MSNLTQANIAEFLDGSSFISKCFTTLHKYKTINANSIEMASFQQSLQELSNPCGNTNSNRLKKTKYYMNYKRCDGGYLNKSLGEILQKEDRIGSIPTGVENIIENIKNDGYTTYGIFPLTINQTNAYDIRSMKMFIKGLPKYHGPLVKEKSLRMSTYRKSFHERTVSRSQTDWSNTSSNVSVNIK